MPRTLPYIVRSLLLFSLLFYPLTAHGVAPDKKSLFDLSLEELMEITVTTASRTTESVEKAPGIITVITRDVIERSGARGLMDVLNMVPGFTVGKCPASNSLYVRGAFSEGNSNAILMMIDGRRLNNPFSGNAFDFYDIPVGNIKQIEIIRGPGSALYGANAAVAVINIITETAEDIDGVETAFRAGNFDSRYGYVNAGKKLNDDFSYAISGQISSYENTDLPREDYTYFGELYSGLADADIDDYASGEGKIVYKNLTLYGNYNSHEYHHAGAGVPEALADDEDYLYASEKDEVQTGASHDWNISKTLRLNTEASYSETENDIRNTAVTVFHIYHPLTPDAMAASNTVSLWAKSADVETRLTYHPVEAHQVVVGIKYRQEKETAEIWNDMVWGAGGVTGTTTPYLLEVAIDGEIRRIRAEYAQYTWKPSDVFSLTGGVRSDHYNDVGTAVTPRMSAVFIPTQKVTLKLLYGQAFREPSFYELYFTHPGWLIPAGPTLDPEVFQTYEAQVIYKPLPTLAFTCNGFFYDVKDVIRLLPTPDPDDLPILNQFTNKGTRNGEGVETEVLWTPTPSSRLYLNYSYVWAEDKPDGVKTDVFGIPLHSVNAAYSQNITDSVSFSLSLNHRRDWVTRPGVEGVEALSIPDYTLVDGHFQVNDITGFIKNLDFTFDVFNIFDEVMYFADPIMNTFPSAYTRGGRQFLAGFRLRF